jgi:transketolase
MTVLSPCDATQARLATLAAGEQATGPVYVRFGREAVPDFTSEEMGFTIGKAQVLLDGEDITVISTGHLTWEALQACYLLDHEGIRARLINMHTIKPIDEEIIIRAARETGAIVTAEEHQVTGGLGGAVAEVVVKNHPVPMAFVGMKDCFGESGKPEELMVKYGLKARDVVVAVKRLIDSKIK